MHSSHQWTAARGLLACVLVGAAATAQAQSFGAKPGAWEITTTISGLAIPPDRLAKIPPEQRAMAEKMMAERGSQPVIHKVCVKKEDLDRDQFGRGSDPSCTRRTVTRTSTKLVQEVTCPGPPPTTSTATFEAKSGESVVGTADQQRGDGSKVHVGMVGRWLGASCDGTEAMGPPPKR
jgi:hypothetical protein